MFKKESWSALHFFYFFSRHFFNLVDKRPVTSGCICQQPGDNWDRCGSRLCSHQRRMGSDNIPSRSWKRTDQKLSSRAIKLNLSLINLLSIPQEYQYRYNWIQLIFTRIYRHVKLEGKLYFQIISKCLTIYCFKDKYIRC